MLTTKYVLWDGSKVSDYCPSIYKDYIIPHRTKPLKGKDVSKDCIAVQDIRKKMIDSGHKPIIVFSCQPGCESIEIIIDGRHRGLFSYCWEFILGNTQSPYTLKDAVTQVNKMMSSKNQVAETITPEDALDIYVKDLRVPFIPLIFDCCRTRKEAEEDVI